MANKRTKLEDAELFYVQVNPHGLSQEKLALKFDTTVKNVAKIQSEYAAAQAVENPQPKEQKVARTLLNTNSDKGRKGITVMTEAASYHVDDNTKISSLKKKGDKYANKHTTKTFPDDN